MGYQWKRAMICVLVMVCCLLLPGCGKEKKQTPMPDVTTTGGPILPQVTQPNTKPVEHTAVYASSFGDLVILATVPVQEWGGEEPDCPAREISNGGRIRCNGEHEMEVPTTRVLILEHLEPRSCSGWFRDMIHLEKIEGTEKLHTENVKDMSYMFASCEKLETLDWSSWDVSALENSTGMFTDCIALESLPQWYHEAE